MQLNIDPPCYANILLSLISCFLYYLVIFTLSVFHRTTLNISTLLLLFRLMLCVYSIVIFALHVTENCVKQFYISPGLIRYLYHSVILATLSALVFVFHRITYGNSTNLLLVTSISYYLRC
jgi:hypothetical protein